MIKDKALTDDWYSKIGLQFNLFLQLFHSTSYRVATYYLTHLPGSFPGSIRGLREREGTE